jgi:hypothetical protein
MTSLPDMGWGFIGSLAMPGFEAVRSPMSSQGVAPFEDFSYLNLPWESVDELYRKDSIAG